MRYIYTLDETHTPHREPDILVWAEWMVHNNIVAHTTIDANVKVSTAFLGIDTTISAKGPPLLFETMVLGGPLDQKQWRYPTWAKAMTGHTLVVARARGE